MNQASAPLRVGLVAGETSGDTLGAALITALRERVPDVQVFGMAGPKMVAAGCEPWVSSDELGVMGLVEVVSHLPRLLALRRSLVDRLLRERPDVVVGIDVPDFNLGLEKRLKRRGLRTVQYVSPQVWAWRQGRVRTIGRACDLVLCLLPFETEFYSRHGVRAEFVGHPLADQIPLDVDRDGARRALGIAPDATVVALLPGSRMGEVTRLGDDFLAAAAWIAQHRPNVKFLAPMASHRVRVAFERQLAAARGLVRGEEGSPAAAVAARDTRAALAMHVLDGQAQRALAAADGVIVASGTATLETLLSKRPMVVAYRLGALTAFLLKRFGLVKVPYFSQPNLLLGRARVPEFFQEGVTGAALGEALLKQMDDRAQVAELQKEFRRVHEVLRRGGAARAASAILEYVGINSVAPAGTAVPGELQRHGAEEGPLHASGEAAIEEGSAAPAGVALPGELQRHGAEEGSLRAGGAAAIEEGAARGEAASSRDAELRDALPTKSAPGEAPRK